MLLKKIFIFAVLLPFFSFAQNSFYFQNTEIKAGTKQHFKVVISTEKDSTFIPITVFNGMHNGKTLGITAGIHGFEYTPILAAQKLIKSIDLSHLKGVVILIQAANVQSFLGRSPFISPGDEKNLNRSFPGSKDGTLTDRIAYFISQNIIPKADYFVDMHSGDAPEDLMKYSAYYANSKMPEVSAKGKEMAVALGFDHVILFDTDGKNYMNKDEPSLYTTAEAFKRGIPSIDIECGRLGIIEKDAVDEVEQSVLHLLDYLKFTEADTKSTKKNAPQFITKRFYTKSNFDGFFYPSKKAGEVVKKGMKLGHITDFFGETLETIYAQEDGFILLIVGTPPINKNEDLIVIAK